MVDKEAYIKIMVQREIETKMPKKPFNGDSGELERLKSDLRKLQRSYLKNHPGNLSFNQSPS